MNSNYVLPLLISASALITMLLFFITIFILINKNKHRRLYAEKVAMEHAYEKALLTARLEVQEQSFTVISQEIHDNICQVLGYVKNSLYLMTYKETLSETKKIAEESTELVGKSIQDLRNLSHILNPEYIKLAGLEEAIKKDLNHLKSFYNIDYSLDVSGEPIELSENKEIIIFRIIQEALSNISRHSDASSVSILIIYAKTITIKIVDNGRGFNVSQVDSSGIGLINMRQRAKVINSDFSIESIQGVGTTVSIKVDSNGTDGNI